MLPKYKLRGQAYEAAERLHLEHFGQRRFSEYQNFLAARRRLKM